MIENLYKIVRYCYGNEFNERKTLAFVSTKADAEYIVTAMEVFESFSEYKFQIIRNYSVEEIPVNRDDMSTDEIIKELKDRQQHYITSVPKVNIENNTEN